MIRTRVANGLLAAAIFLTGCTSEAQDHDEDTQAFCLRLRAAVSESSAVNQIDLADPASIDAAILQLEQVRAFAPSAVADDVDTVVDAFTVLVEALEVPDNRNPAEVISEQSESLTEAAEAGERLQRYSAEECDVNLAPPAQPTATPESGDDIAPA